MTKNFQQRKLAKIIPFMYTSFSSIFDWFLLWSIHNSNCNCSWWLGRYSLEYGHQGPIKIIPPSYHECHNLYKPRWTRINFLFLSYFYLTTSPDNLRCSEVSSLRVAAATCVTHSIAQSNLLNQFFEVSLKHLGIFVSSVYPPPCVFLPSIPACIRDADGWVASLLKRTPQTIFVLISFKLSFHAMPPIPHSLSPNIEILS